jgi:hypothetical protein
MLLCSVIRSPQPRSATSSSRRCLPLSPFYYTHRPILCLSLLPTSPNSTHPSQLDTPVPSQLLCYQSHPHAFRHTWGCASVFTSDFALSTRYRSFRSIRINIIPRHLAVLCFHTLTHSSAPSKTLTPAFSIICALFPQNTRGGVCRTSHFPLLSIHPPPLSAHHLLGLKPVPQRAHPYPCTCKKGPAAREPRC